MAISRKKKEEIVSQAAKVARAAENLFFVDASAMKAGDLNELRKKIKSAGGTFQFIKKRLAKRAFEAAEKLHPEIFEKKGSLAMVTAKEEPIQTAKTLYQTARKNEALKIIGAFLEKTFLSAAEIVNLAKLPSREALFGQLVGVLSSPMRSLMTVLNANTQKLVLTLEIIKRSKT